MFPYRNRVLVVDDYRESARVLAQLLELFGFETFLAHDGASAIARAAEVAPDAVILDVILPDMDGVTVARRLRAQPETENAVLIALTGYPLDEGPHRAKTDVFDHQFVKPVAPSALRDVLANALTASAPAAR